MTMIMAKMSKTQRTVSTVPENEAWARERASNIEPAMWSTCGRAC